MAKRLRGITSWFCVDHARGWTEFGGRLYGAPCKDREACKANGMAHPSTALLVPKGNSQASEKFRVR